MVCDKYLNLLIKKLFRWNNITLINDLKYEIDPKYNNIN